MIADSQFFLANGNNTPDKLSHIIRAGQNSFGVEDLVGGDCYFDDMVAEIAK